VHVVRHGGRYLALEEGTPPYELGADLATMGRCEFDGRLPDGICAHPKVDPATGEMVTFRYDVAAPFLTWSIVGADGAVSVPPQVVDGVDEGYMIHDFAITEHHIVLVVGPLVFDLDLMAKGRPPLAWRPELGTRIAVIPRDRKGAVRWIHRDAFWAWHYANAYEDGDTIVLDFPMTPAPSLIAPDAPAQGAAGFTRAVLHPDAGALDLDVVADAGTEFPRIDDRLVGRRHRYVTVAGASDRGKVAKYEHDVIRRFDVEQGTAEAFVSNAAMGETVFAPRSGSTSELDGYYLAYGTDVDSGRSALHIWDAGEFPRAPVATVYVPHRIPNGLHGSWFATED
jgi:carotenoid cleavage dioxygenase